MVSFKNCPDVLTVAELALLLNISQRSVYQLLQNNKIGHRKIGRIYRIPKESVIEFLYKN